MYMYIHTCIHMYMYVRCLHRHLDWCIASTLPIPEYSPLSAGSTHAVCTCVRTLYPELHRQTVVESVPFNNLCNRSVSVC